MYNLKNTVKKIIKSCVSGLFVLSFIFSFVIAHVQASETAGQSEVISADETGKLKLTCTYSSDIKPDENDIFTISYALTGLSEVKTLKIDATSASKGEIETDVPYGIYNVLDISYEGNNEKIEAQGYGVDLIFRSVEGEDTDVLQVAVGSEAGRKLEAEGNGILAKIRGYIVNSFDDQPMEGEIDTSENQETEEIAITDPDNNEQATNQSDEKLGETVYYDKDVNTQKNTTYSIKKIFPLIGMAGMCTVVVFILHKRGKI